MKAEYEHDCDVCEYKTTIRIGPTLYDIYKCTNSYIARFGDEGSEYSSIPIELKYSFITHPLWKKVIEICEAENEDNGRSI